MSIAVPSAILETSLLQSLNTTPSKTSSTTSLASQSGTTSDSSNGNAGAVTAITKDLTSLLKALVHGDANQAQTDLSKLQEDLKSQQEDEASQNKSQATATATTPNALQALLSQITSSLGSGGTEAALQSLASYLVSTGLGTGNLVNTTA
jgi:hypothetical protein